MRKEWLARLDQARIDAHVAAGTWHNVVMSDVVRSLADRAVSPLAAIDGDHQLSYRDIWSDAVRLASALGARGLRPGDVVSFQLPNWHEVMVINVAACMAGLVCNPIVPIYRDSEVEFILRDSGAKALFIPDSFRSMNYIDMVERIRPGLPDLAHVILVRSAHDDYEDFAALIADQRELMDFTPPSPNAAKLLMYTSGTTGKPKGVVHTHNTLWSETIAVRDFWAVSDTDRIFMASPVTHITGYIYGLELAAAGGIPTVFMDKWEADRAIDLIRRHRATFTVAATPFLVELARSAKAHDEPLESMRLFACGGAPVAPELIIEATRILKNCQAARVYGSTEAPTVSPGILPTDDPQRGAHTDGRVVNSEVRIVDAAGNIVAPGGEGEICVRGPEVMIGYADPAANADAFDSDGFFRTGDLGVLDGEGFLTITGRKKDLIIRGGENISPKEIEDCLMAHPDIKEASVVAAPHARLGETVMAYLIAEGERLLTLQEVAGHLDRLGLAKQKLPEFIEYLPDFPRTASGKVKKNVLRDQARQERR